MIKAPLKLKIPVISVALLIFLVMAMNAVTAAKTEKKDGQLEIGGPVSIGQCTACHYDLDAFKNERLIFSHNDHFLSGVGCPSCHEGFPHNTQGTQRPNMQSCMNCHNLHGTLQQSLVTDCRECHPPSFNLRPAQHIPDAWVGDLHVRSAERDINYCLTCHKAEGCKECHAQRGVKERPDSFYKKKSVTVIQTTTPAVVNMKGQIEISSCQYCHGDLEAFKNPGLIFNHKAHFAKGIKCFSCHQQWPHTRAGVEKPSMDICYGCHGLTHANNGVVAPENCDLCHPPGFDLRPKDHTAEFVSGSHKNVVEKRYFNCMTCHDDKDFCTPCHTRMNVVPKSHRRAVTGVQTASNADWLNSHGKNIDYDYCALCHDNAFCTRCHRTQMPHEVLFVATHKDIARGMRQECAICHKDESTCSSCHHRFNQTETLVASACEKCHQEVNRPLLEVGDKGLMVHKAHFEMTNTEPFACNKCHAATYAADKRCFQFELCYSCHGRYRADKLIAKWPGSQLCYRCHPQNR